MTNRIALILGVLLLAVFVSDALLFQARLDVFVGRQLLNLTDYIAFWR